MVAWLVAFPVLMHEGRRQWFFLDEWAFLAGRELSDVGGLLEPHNEHWVTVPVVLYRLVHRVVGLNHYWPYLLLVVVAHLAAAALLRVVMRRAGADPWVATGCAVLFTYFGSGRENFGWGFQVGFSGALAFGLAHLILADRPEGSITRRDLLGLVFGLLAIMSTGVGVFMVLAVGVATFLRRGARVAAFHVVPLAAIYLLWWAVLDPPSSVKVSAGVLGALPRAVVEQVFGGMAGRPALGGLLLVLVVGGVVVGVSRDRGVGRSRWSMPTGLAVGAFGFLLLTAMGRSFYLSATQGAGPLFSRYVHILTALLLPGVAVAITSLVRRSRWLIVPALVLLLVGLAGNIDRLGPRGMELYLLGSPDNWAALADVVVAHPVPGHLTLHPDADMPWTVSVAWLREERVSGRFRPREHVPDETRRAAEFELFIRSVPTPAGPCEVVGTGSVRLDRGQTAMVPLTRARVTLVDDGEAVMSRLLASVDQQVAVRSTTERVRLRLENEDGAEVEISRCG